MRRRITRDTDPQGSRQHAIHPGVRRQDDAPRFESLTEFRLQMSADRDQHRRRIEPPQVIDKLELLFWSQGGLQDDDVVALPGARMGLCWADRLYRYPEPPGGRPEPLGEQQFVLHQEERFCHGRRIAPDLGPEFFLLSPIALGACYNRARESWVEGYGSLRRNL